MTIKELKTKAQNEPVDITESGIISGYLSKFDNEDSYGSFKRMSLGPNVVRSKSIDEHRQKLLFSLGMYTKSVSDDEIQYDIERIDKTKSLNYGSLELNKEEKEVH